MTSVGSLSSYASYSATTTKNRQQSVENLADRLLSQIDTQQQGFIDKSELQAALSTSSGDSSTSTNVDNLFSALDQDGDGKITKSELSSSLESVLGQVDDMAAKMRAHGGQHPNARPPASDQSADEGFTQEQLTQIAEETSETDSKRSNFMADVAAHFEEADSNGDGKVNRDEAMAYAKASGQDSGPSKSGEPQGVGGPPPGPPPGAGPVATTENSSDSSSSTSSDPADTNGDGTVSSAEALAYLLKQMSSSEDSTSVASSSTASSSTDITARGNISKDVERQILQLIKTYGLQDSTAVSTTNSSDSSLTESA